MDATVCVLDVACLGEGDVFDRLLSAVQRLHKDGLNVIVLTAEEEIWQRLRLESIDQSRCLFVKAFNEPTVLDALEQARNYSAYFVSSNTLGLERDWRLTPVTAQWLQKNRKKMQVAYRFEQGDFIPEWPTATASPFLAPKAAPVSKSSAYPGPDPWPETPRLATSELGSVVKLPTGWISDGLEPEMAVLPIHVHGSLQIILAIMGVNEKDPLLQQAAMLCGNLPCEDIKEEEDLSQWRHLVRGPWSDQGLTSHVAYAIGGQLDGLWAVGVGSKKVARRRAAKLALVISARQGGADLQHLAERAQILRSLAQSQEMAIEPVNQSAAATWLS